MSRHPLSLAVSTDMQGICRLTCLESSAPSQSGGHPRYTVIYDKKILELVPWLARDLFVASLTIQASCLVLYHVTKRIPMSSSRHVKISERMAQLAQIMAFGGQVSLERKSHSLEVFSCEDTHRVVVIWHTADERIKNAFFPFREFWPRSLFLHNLGRRSVHTLGAAREETLDCLCLFDP